MSARDVIEAALTQKGVVGVLRADYVIARLTAAGWRLVGPDEVDPVTVERCIAIVEAKAPKDTGKWCPYRAWAVGSIPTLRAIASGGKQ